LLVLALNKAATPFHQEARPPFRVTALCACLQRSDIVDQKAGTASGPQEKPTAIISHDQQVTEVCVANGRYTGVCMYFRVCYLHISSRQSKAELGEME